MLPTKDRFTIHPASCRTEIMSSANWAASSSPSLVKLTAEPADGFNRETNLLCWLGLILRWARRPWSPNKANSAFAARSCCLATSSWRVATSLVASAARLFASAASSLASSMRASASSRTASWTLFPEFHTSQVNRATTSAVRTRTTIYAANSFPCCLVAASIADSPGCIFAIAILAIGGTFLAVLAIKSNNRRMKNIRRRYCNTQIHLDKP